ncbi:hypothetical protein NQ318_019221 [Aromia moschata]|uniref:Protein kinase domain-containing protein n=1 Tax=Aromia moschata TaxID=1265417 RepID=A0AAV8YY60_9CUCU|nr:hypothetical protein NQ318_019221 [Aromia moschata]
MEVFNKLYSQVSSSVSSTVSQLSGVLPGNPVTREFESSAHIASAGPGLLWKIYKGSKRSTKQEASIFVFEKRQLEKWNKNDREIILETLRRGVVQLTKIRHPKVLTVQHPLEESRESLAFATEPVFASLANVLGQTTNMPQPANMSDYKFYDIEIKYGLLQISEGLAFLHNDMKLLHKNISPESIIINSQGAWKIFGLDFCVHNTSPPNSAPNYPFEDYNPTLPNICQPNIEYLAPECILSQNHSPSSDMFSLGMLAYTLNSPERKCIKSVKDVQHSTKLQCVPEELREFVKLLLSVTPEVRPDAHQFIKIPFFDDVGIKTLTYLDSLLQWDNLQKSQVFQRPWANSPQRVKVQRVLACLVHDLGQPAMVPFILPSIFDIAQDCTQKEYCLHILPHIKPLMKLMEPIQILLIMLQRMELLLKLTPAQDIQQHVLPMLYRGLDSDSPQVHELCLSVLPTFAGLLDHSNVKNSLLPRIKKLCLSTSTLSVRVNCLLCVGRLLEHLDKWLVLDEVLPFLPQIPSREPAVLMGILGIYKLALTHKKLGITKEIIATRVLPFLIPLCIENGLTIQQFNALTSLVKEMFQIVETEHRTKLEQLNSVKDEQKVLASTVPIVTPTAKPVELDKAFTGLGLDNFVSSVATPQKQQPTKSFNNSPVEAMKTTSPPITQQKDLSSSLVDEWANVPKITNPPVSNSAAPTSSFPLSPNNNSFPSNAQWSNVTNRSNQQPSSVQSPWGNNSRASSVGPNWSNMTQNYSPFQSGQNVSPNPWASSQAALTYPKPEPAQNWSALDNLLAAGPNNNAKIPMNMMSLNQPLIPSPSSANNNTSSSLSKDDIMDLLR